MKYFIKGLELDSSYIKTVQLITSLGGNYCTLDAQRHLKIFFQPGTRWKNMKSSLLSGMTITDEEVRLTDTKMYHLVPKILYLNTHKVEVYVLDSHAISYIVVTAQKTGSSIKQNDRRTFIVVHEPTARDFNKLSTLLSQLKYIRFLSLPAGEMYSYPNVITTNLKNELDDFLGNSTDGQMNPNTTLGKPEDGNSLGKITSYINRPIDLGGIYDYRIDAGHVLERFQQYLMKNTGNKFSLLLDGKPRPGCETVLSSNTINIRFQNMANLEKRPRIYDREVMDSSMILNVTFNFSDHGDYLHHRRKYQNVEWLTNDCVFKTKDIYGYDWNTSIWWEVYTDSLSPVMTTEQGTGGYPMQVQCKLYFFEVRDEVRSVVDSIILTFPQYNETYTIK